MSEDIEAFCDRVVAETGVLLLPATQYDHPASVAAGRVRIGLGRRNFAECLDRLRPFFRALQSAAPA